MFTGDRILPSGKRLHHELERSTHVQWVNPLFRLGYSSDFHHSGGSNKKGILAETDPDVPGSRWRQPGGTWQNHGTHWYKLGMAMGHFRSFSFWNYLGTDVDPSVGSQTIPCNAGMRYFSTPSKRIKSSSSRSHFILLWDLVGWMLTTRLAIP